MSDREKVILDNVSAIFPGALPSRQIVNTCAK
jgi:hypothetical protein